MNIRRCKNSELLMDEETKTEKYIIRDIGEWEPVDDVNQLIIFIQVLATTIIECYTREDINNLIVAHNNTNQHLREQGRHEDLFITLPHTQKKVNKRLLELFLQEGYNTFIFTARSFLPIDRDAFFQTNENTPKEEIDARVLEILGEHRMRINMEEYRNILRMQEQREDEARRMREQEEQDRNGRMLVIQRFEQEDYLDLLINRFGEPVVRQVLQDIIQTMERRAVEDLEMELPPIDLENPTAEQLLDHFRRISGIAIEILAEEAGDENLEDTMRGILNSRQRLLERNVVIEQQIAEDFPLIELMTFEDELHVLENLLAAEEN